LVLFSFLQENIVTVKTMESINNLILIVSIF
jgi:hypothetical protein